MALIRELVLPSLIECPEAYSKITDITLSYAGQRAEFTVATFKDREAMDKGAAPIFRDNYRVYGNNEKPKTGAVYQLSLATVQDTTQVNAITFDFAGDGKDVVAVNSEKDSALSIADIIAQLTANATFAESWVATAMGDSSLSISAIKGGSYFGTLGNKVTATGTLVVSFTRTSNGDDGKPTDFDMYFSVSALSPSGVNVLSATYSFLKTTDDFKNAKDYIYEQHLQPATPPVETVIPVVQSSTLITSNVTPDVTPIMKASRKRGR